MRHQSSDFTENAYLFLGDVQNYHVLLSTVIAQEFFYTTDIQNDSFSLSYPD
jgi:hypothetical protein